MYRRTINWSGNSKSHFINKRMVPCEQNFRPNVLINHSVNKGRNKFRSAEKENELVLWNPTPHCWPSLSMESNTVLYSTVQFSILKYSILKYSKMHYSTVTCCRAEDTYVQYCREHYLSCKMLVWKIPSQSLHCRSHVEIWNIMQSSTLKYFKGNLNKVL